MKSEQNKENSAEDGHRLLFRAILTLRSEEEARKFFQDLCTPAELQDFADRWRVVAPLKEGTSYRKIYEDTGVSVTTIGRVARSLKYGEGGYDLVFKRVMRASNVQKNPIKSGATKKRTIKQRVA